MSKKETKSTKEFTYKYEDLLKQGLMDGVNKIGTFDLKISNFGTFMIKIQDLSDQLETHAKQFDKIREELLKKHDAEKVTFEIPNSNGAKNVRYDFPDDESEEAYNKELDNLKESEFTLSFKKVKLPTAIKLNSYQYGKLRQLFLEDK